MKISMTFYKTVGAYGVLGCLLLSTALPIPEAHASQTTTTSISSSTSSVDFNALPRAGMDAFWAINPQNPSQKILLVPSSHQLSLRFTKPDIVAAIKSSNALIIESLAGGSRSWDDATILREAFKNLPPFEALENLKVLSKEGEDPFIIEDDKPWSDSALLSDKSKAFIAKNIEPVLGRSSDLIHPFAVLMALNYAADIKSKHITMDAQIANFFELSNRQVFGLETKEEALGKSQEEMTDSFMKQLYWAPINRVLSSINAFVDKMGEVNNLAPNESFTNAKKILDDVDTRYKRDPFGVRQFQMRNMNWISQEPGKLLWYLQKYPNKSFVIVVGAAHFPGESGIFNLLADKGFTFTPFDSPSSKAIVSPKNPHEILLEELIENNTLTKIEEPGPNIKDELLHVIENISTTTIPRILKIVTDPQKREETIRKTYQSFLNLYINNRNTLFADPEIKDKEKIIKVLMESSTISLPAAKQKILQQE